MMLRRVVLAGLLVEVAGAGACTSVRHVQAVPYLADNNPAVVWVTSTHHTVVPLTAPVIRRDTLRGTWRGERVKIPVSDIQTLQVRVPNHTKTALLGVALGVAGVSAVYFAFISQAGPGGDGTNCGLTIRGDQIQVC